MRLILFLYFASLSLANAAENSDASCLMTFHARLVGVYGKDMGGGDGELFCPGRLSRPMRVFLYPAAPGLTPPTMSMNALIRDIPFDYFLGREAKTFFAKQNASASPTSFELESSGASAAPGAPLVTLRLESMGISDQKNFPYTPDDMVRILRVNLDRSLWVIVPRPFNTP